MIEDGVGSIGAYFEGKPCGTIGDLGIFSFGGRKTQGMVLPVWSAKKKRYANHQAYLKKYNLLYEGNPSGCNYLKNWRWTLSGKRNKQTILQLAGGIPGCRCTIATSTISGLIYWLNVITVDPYKSELTKRN